MTTAWRGIMARQRPGAASNKPSKCLPCAPDRDVVTEKARDGRGLQAIREIPVYYAGALRKLVVKD